MNESITEEQQAPVVDKKIIRQYYDAVAEGVCEEFLPMQIFKEQHPKEFKFLSAVHRKRTIIRECIKSMEIVSSEIYFGTLTFNNEKNENKEACKRKEAFNVLNSEFEYVLLVEEYGVDNGRYHIHFLGVFKLDHDFNTFVRAWSHSRQNLRLVKENEPIAQYLCKYMCKQLPRIRRNKKLVALAREYHKAKSLLRFFPDVKEFSPVVSCRNYHFVSALDDV